MDALPLYISITFIATTLLTFLFFYSASGHSRYVLIFSLLWLGIQAILGTSGFYLVMNTIPPRLIVLIGPPMGLIILLMATKKGRSFSENLNLTMLTHLHVVRIPVEFVLLWLSLQQVVPELMTFEGRNFDIFSGISAPAIAYFGLQKRQLPKAVLLIWNFICLGLLLNIMFHGILSAPTLFQQFAFEQPNLALAYFPFVWLPSFIVPIVLYAHVVSIKKIVQHKP